MQWSIFLGLLVLGARADLVVNSKGFDVGVLECALAHSQSEGSDLVFDARVNKSRYKIGDALQLDVTAEGDMYITVLDHGSDPAIQKRNHTLFSNVYIKRGDTYQFPPPNAGTLRIDPPIGTNWFEVIASKAPLENPEANSKNVNLIPPEQDKQQDIETSNCTLSFEIVDAK